MTKIIDIKDLYFRYNTRDDFILNGIDLTIYEKEVLAIVGPSGSGKTTLMQCICGIIPHLADGKLKGEVKLLNRNIKNMSIPEISSKIGIVFQDPDSQLFSPTVENEIAFGPENFKVDREEIDRRIEKVLKMVNMEDHRYDNPNNLSGGQKQLIAIASVLAMETEILIFDEVVSQVDNEGKKRINDVIKKLKDEGKTIIMVEHNLDNLKIADRIVKLSNGKLQEFKGW